MTKDQIHAQIIQIQNDFGISNAKMGELCGLSGHTYAKCKSDKAEKNSFNIGNLERLKVNLKQKIDRLL